MKVKVLRHTDGAATRLVVDTGQTAAISSFMVQKRREGDQYFSLKAEGLTAGENWIPVSEGWNGPQDGHFRFFVTTALAACIDPGPVSLSIKTADGKVETDSFVWPGSPPRAGLADTPPQGGGQEVPRPVTAYVISALALLLAALLIGLYINCQILPAWDFLRSCPAPTSEDSPALIEPPLEEDTKPKEEAITQKDTLPRGGESPQKDTPIEDEKSVPTTPKPLPELKPDDAVWVAGQLSASTVTDQTGLRDALNALNARSSGPGPAKEFLLIDGDLTPNGSQADWFGTRKDMQAAFGAVLTAPGVTLLFADRVKLRFSLNPEDWQASTLLLGDNSRVTATQGGVMIGGDPATSCPGLLTGDVVTAADTIGALVYPYDFAAALLAAQNEGALTLDFTLQRENASIQHTCPLAALMRAGSRP